MVRLLLDLPLERGVNPAVNDNQALKNACICGFTDIVRLLLDLPLDRGVNNNDAFRSASEIGHTEIVRLLLGRRGVDDAAL